MGQAAGLLLGAAGAVVGGFFGGPMGAEAGFMIGSMIGGLLLPPKHPAPQDLRVQDSAYGKFIPQVWGRYRVAGNMIWAGTPHNHDPNGKGGMGKGGNQAHVTMSFAVALCKGPIAGINRIWANGKLIYDVSNPSDWKSISGSASMVTGWTFYPGDENQTADPVMESQLGAGNVPAYRGLCYVVFNELNLQQWGNYLPSLSFEVLQVSSSQAVTTNIQTFTNAPGIVNPSQLTLISQMQSNGTAYGFFTAQQGGILVGQFFQVSPYGVAWNQQIIPLGINWMPTLGIYSYDEPGMLVGSGAAGLWLTNSGLTYNVNLPVGLGQNQSAVKRGGTIFWVNADGGARTPLYAAQPALQGGSPAQPAVVGPQSFNFYKVLCATDSYVYCSTTNIDPLYPSSILKFDHNCNLVGVLYGSGGAGWSAVPGAYAVSDSEIYFVPGAVPGDVYKWNGSAMVLTDITGVRGANLGSMFVGGGAQFGLFANYDTESYYAIAVGQTSSSPLLSSVVGDICGLAGLQPTQYSASALNDTVVGFANTGNASPRDMLTPLMATYFFDVSDSDGQLKFVRRGAAPATTIPWDDLGAAQQQDGFAALNPITEAILQEYELPAIETLSYISASSDYQTSTQREFMPGTTSNLYENANVPIVLGDNDAKVRVQAMLWERWAVRRTFKFDTGYKYMAFEPGDTVNLQYSDGTAVPVRVLKTQFDGKGVMSWEADFLVPQIYPTPGQSYTAQGQNSVGFPKQSVDYSGPTVLVPMDLPPLRPQDATAPGLYLAADGFDPTWPGCYVDMSRDDVSFTQLFTMSTASVIGTTTTALPAFLGGNIVDENSTVTVQLYDPQQSLSSVSYQAFLNGANAALIGGEIVYFRNAVQLTASTWQLSGFLRYMLDTPVQGAVSQAAGATFVLLNEAAMNVAPLNLADIGQTLYFETYLRNIFGTQPGSTVAVQPANARLAPFSPAQLAAAKGAYGSGAGYSSSDIVLRWYRRARINYNWIESADIPLDWSQESYRVLVANGAGQVVNQYVVNSQGITWSGSAGNAPQSVPTNPSGQPLPQFVAPQPPVFVYRGAWATADGFSAGQTIQFSVQQIGDYGVAGHVSTVTTTR